MFSTIKRKDLIYDILEDNEVAKLQFIIANEDWIEEIVKRYVIMSNLPISVLQKEVHLALINAVIFHRNIYVEIVVCSYLEQLILENG